MSREVCGICWCPYDENTGACACPPPNVQKSTLRDAAVAALEALEYGGLLKKRQAITTLRAALAEHEPPIGKASTDVGVPVYVVKKAEPATLDEAMAVPLSLAQAYENGWNAAKAEQGGPVAWRWGYRSITTGEMDWRGYVEIAAHPNLRSPAIIMEPLYTAPPQRKPLSEEEIEQCFQTACAKSEEQPRTWKWSEHFARAVERAHGIKP